MAVTNILVIDDDPEICGLVKDCSEYDNVRIITSSNVFRAMNIASSFKIDFAIIDLFLPVCMGYTLIQFLEKKNIPTIAVSGFGKNYLNLAEDIGAKAIIEKPFSTTALMTKFQEIRPS